MGRDEDILWEIKWDGSQMSRNKDTADKWGGVKGVVTQGPATFGGPAVSQKLKYAKCTILK